MRLIGRVQRPTLIVTAVYNFRLHAGQIADSVMVKDLAGRVMSYG